VLLAACALLAACQTPPALAPLLQDESPERPTAVQESFVTSTGVNGLAPFEGSIVVLTRPDMRREQTSLKGTGTMGRLLIGTENRAQVTWLDQGRIWDIDIGRGEYRDCPLTGCPTQRTREGTPGPAGAAPASCRLRVVGRSQQTLGSGARQDINGWPTAQSQIVLALVLEDSARRRSTSTLTAELWTTPATPAMQAVHEIERRFEQEAARATRAVAVRRVPAELRELADSLLAEAMSAADRAVLFDLERDLADVAGQPVRTTLRWDVRGDACGDSGFGLGTLAAGAAAPLFAITHELRRYEVAPVRDSSFYLPTHYRQRQR
jgi:hypothetical protein